jgi:hypothetical protein
MRLVLLLMTVAALLVARASAAKTPKACHECPTACGNDVSDCVQVMATTCPSTPRAKAHRCLKKAKRHCRKSINGCCVDTCRETGAPACCGAASTTTTTEPGGGGNPCFTDAGDGTIHDSCTGVQWEKKVGAKGVHHPGDLHDINDVYPWAGTCARNASLFCQPDAAAAATCTALADGGTGASAQDGCSECPGGIYDPTSNPSGTGPCRAAAPATGPITTVWVWLNQLNASNFAGHSDWRLPSQAARNTCPPGEPNCATTATPRELETIVRGAPASCGPPCYYPIFGVPVSLQTWSSSTAAADSRFAWLVNFFTGTNERVNKNYGAASVRAVRTLAAP